MSYLNFELENAQIDFQKVLNDQVIWNGGIFWVGYPSSIVLPPSQILRLLLTF